MLTVNDGITRGHNEPPAWWRSLARMPQPVWCQQRWVSEGLLEDEQVRRALVGSARENVIRHFRAETGEDPTRVRIIFTRDPGAPVDAVTLLVVAFRAATQGA